MSEESSAQSLVQRNLPGSVVLSLLAAGALWALGALQINPLEAAESLLLLQQALFVFGGLVLISRRPSELATALLPILAVAWLLPMSITRGTLFTAVSLLGTGWLTWMRLREEPEQRPIPLSVAAGLAVAAVGLFEARQLLTAATYGRFALLVAASASLLVLAPRWSRGRILILAGSLWILGEGAPSPGMLLAVAAVVAVDGRAFDRTGGWLRSSSWAIGLASITVAALVAGAAFLAADGSWSLEALYSSRVVAGLAVVTVIALLLRPFPKAGWALAGGTLVAAALLLDWSWGPHPGVLRRVIFLLPGAVVAIGFGRPLGLTALALAACTSSFGNAPELLSAAAVVGVAALPERRSLLGAQQAWTALFFAAAACLAGYPWFRTDLVRETIRIFGYELDAVHLVWPVTAMVLAFAAGALAPHPRKVLAGQRVMAASIALLLLSTLGTLDARSRYGPLTLNQERVRTRIGLPTKPTPSRVIIESSVSNGYQIEAGTPVALVRAGLDSKKLGTKALRMGLHTGEWAAERPDIREKFPSEETGVWSFSPWADRSFFARRYRSEWLLDGETTIDELRITLRQDLPADFQLTIHRLEILE